MNTRSVILSRLATTVAEHSPFPTPTDFNDDMLLNEFWLSSLGITSLVARLESDLGFVPVGILRGDEFPQTVGELVSMYEAEMPK